MNQVHRQRFRRVVLALIAILVMMYVASSFHLSRRGFGEADALGIT